MIPIQMRGGPLDAMAGAGRIRPMAETFGVLLRTAAVDPGGRAADAAGLATVAPRAERAEATDAGDTIAVGSAPVPGTAHPDLSQLESLIAGMTGVAPSLAATDPYTVPAPSPQAKAAVTAGAMPAGAMPAGAVPAGSMSVGQAAALPRAHAPVADAAVADDAEPADDDAAQRQSDAPIAPALPSAPATPIPTDRVGPVTGPLPAHPVLAAPTPAIAPETARPRPVSASAPPRSEPASLPRNVARAPVPAMGSTAVQPAADHPIAISSRRDPSTRSRKTPVLPSASGQTAAPVIAAALPTTLPGAGAATGPDTAATPIVVAGQRSRAGPSAGPPAPIEGTFAPVSSAAPESMTGAPFTTPAAPAEAAAPAPDRDAAPVADLPTAPPPPAAQTVPPSVEGAGPAAPPATGSAARAADDPFMRVAEVAGQGVAASPAVASLPNLDAAPATASAPADTGPQLAAIDPVPRPDTMAAVKSPAPTRADKKAQDKAQVAAPDQRPADLPQIAAALGGADAKPRPLDGAVPVPASAPPPAEVMVAHHLDLARDGAWLDQLTQDIVRSADANGALRFSLAPEHLGRLDVTMAATADGTALRLTTQTAEAHRIVADAQPRLVAEARAQGLTLSETTVDLGHASHGGQPQAFGNQNSGGGRHSQHAGWQPGPSAPASRPPMPAAGRDEDLYA